MQAYGLEWWIHIAFILKLRSEKGLSGHFTESGPTYQKIKLWCPRFMVLCFNSKTCQKSCDNWFLCKNMKFWDHSMLIEKTKQLSKFMNYKVDSDWFWVCIHVINWFKIKFLICLKMWSQLVTFFHLIMNVTIQCCNTSACSYIC